MANNALFYEDGRKLINEFKKLVTLKEGYLNKTEN